MKSCALFPLLLLIFNSGSGQVINNKDLRGRWVINDIGGIHRNFRVTLTFKWHSLFREDINDTLVSYELYRLSAEKGNTALVFINYDTTAKQVVYHPLTLRGDTLTLGNFYYPYKPGYNLVQGQSIYFIRDRID